MNLLLKMMLGTSVRGKQNSKMLCYIQPGSVMELEARTKGTSEKYVRLFPSHLTCWVPWHGTQMWVYKNGVYLVCKAFWGRLGGLWKVE